MNKRLAEIFLLRIEVFSIWTASFSDDATKIPNQIHFLKVETNYFKKSAKIITFPKEHTLFLFRM